MHYFNLAIIGACQARSPVRWMRQCCEFARTTDMSDGTKQEIAASEIAYSSWGMLGKMHASCGIIRR
jgi:hypothetical protein